MFLASCFCRCGRKSNRVTKAVASPSAHSNTEAETAENSKLPSLRRKEPATYLSAELAHLVVAVEMGQDLIRKSRVEQYAGEFRAQKYHPFSA